MQIVKIIKKDVKNITLKVKPNCEVVLVAPFCAKDEYLQSFIEQKREWINKKVEYFSKRVEPQKELVSGEDFYYLGKRYRLKVIESEIEGVKLDKEYCYLYVKDKNNFAKKERVIESWYRQEAKELFNKFIEKYQPIVKKEVNRVTIRKMKTRWGSCNYHKGYINLNLELIKKPKEGIEYVVFHELTHLIYPNHSKDFYNYLSTYMPDFRNRKEKLERIL